MSRPDPYILKHDSIMLMWKYITFDHNCLIDLELKERDFAASL